MVRRKKKKEWILYFEVILTESCGRELSGLAEAFYFVLWVCISYLILPLLNNVS